MRLEPARFSLLLLLLLLLPLCFPTAALQAVTHGEEAGSWWAAESACNSAGSNLVTFSNLSDFEEWCSRETTREDLFVGLFKPSQLGWRWANGAPYTWSAVHEMLDKGSDLNTTDMRALCAHVTWKDSGTGRLRLGSCTRAAGFVCEAKRCLESDLLLFGVVPGLLQEMAQTVRISPNGVVSVGDVDAGLGEWVTQEEFRAEVSLERARCVFEATFRGGNGEMTATMGCHGGEQSPAMPLTNPCTPCYGKAAGGGSGSLTEPNRPIVVKRSSRDQVKPRNSVWVWACPLVAVAMGLLVGCTVRRRRHHRGKRGGKSVSLGQDFSKTDNVDDCTTCNTSAATKLLMELYGMLQTDLESPLLIRDVHCEHKEGGEHVHCFDVGNSFGGAALAAVASFYLRKKPRLLKGTRFQVNKVGQPLNDR